MQEQWWQNKAAEFEHYADTHNAKKFFSSLKTVFGPSTLGCTPLLSSDGRTLIKDQDGLSKHLDENSKNSSKMLKRPWFVKTDTLN